MNEEDCDDRVADVRACKKHVIEFSPEDQCTICAASHVKRGQSNVELEARVESLTQERGAFALQLEHLRKYFDRAVTQESALRGRVESLEKALKQLSEGGWLVQDVREIARKALDTKGESQ